MYEQALEFAREKHCAQVRKYTEEPYINHCIHVVDILKSFGIDNEAVLCAAILHDTVEDTNTSFKEIKNKFGSEVMTLVFFLTDIVPKEGNNREIRNELNNHHIVGTSDFRSLLIKCADLISNTESIVRFDPDFAIVYLKEKQRLLNFMWNNKPEISNYPIFKEALRLAQQEIPRKK